MSGGSQGDWHAPADRLALFMRRYGLNEDRVARQLGWTADKLRAYIAPDARRRKLPSDIADTAVDKLLMRYRVALAHKTLMGASSKPLTPMDAGARRSSVPSQFARSVVDRRSVIHADATADQLKAAEEASNSGSSNRKRKRKVIVQALAASGPVKEGDAVTDQLDVRKAKRVLTELICPIRLDVDLDGVRFQDTFLLNAANPMCSPEAIASQIAIDEKMSDKLKDAIAESIRRQILAFTSCISTERHTDRLHPIYLDLVINGFSLRDQFEWDIANGLTAAQKFASTLCADLNLPAPFETAIVFSIYEQVAAYRTAVNGRKWIGNSHFHVKNSGIAVPAGSAGYIETMPPLDDVIRDETTANLWQPVLSELSREERTYLSARFTATRAPTSWKSAPVVSQINDQKRSSRHLSRENRGVPRPINPFIVYCQMQKEALGKTRRSASETRKIFGDMWRKCTDEEKDYYSRLTEIENEKRRRDHVLDLRDRAIVEWEEEEARRKGLVSSSTLETSAEYLRGLLLEDYMNERHEVDQNRAEAGAETGDEEDEDM